MYYNYTKKKKKIISNNKNNNNLDKEIETKDKKEKVLTWGEHTNMMVTTMKNLHISQAIKQLQNFINHTPTLVKIKQLFGTL